jgi:hypothetical protein
MTGVEKSLTFEVISAREPEQEKVLDLIRKAVQNEVELRLAILSGSSPI